jgi:hypothetical protein
MFWLDEELDEFRLDCVFITLSWLSGDIAHIQATRFTAPIMSDKNINTIDMPTNISVAASINISASSVCIIVITVKDPFN